MWQTMLGSSKSIQCGQMLSRDSLQILQLRVTESLTQLATAFHLSTVYICLSASIQLLICFSLQEESKYRMTFRPPLQICVCTLHRLELRTIYLIGSQAFCNYNQKKQSILFINIQKYSFEFIVPKLVHRNACLYLYILKIFSRTRFRRQVHSMSEMFADNNYLNMKNITQSRHNFNQVFSYLNGIIKQAAANYKELASRTIQLEVQLAKKDPHNLLLLEKTKVKLSFGEAAIRISDFSPHNSKKLESFSHKTQNNIQTPSSKKSKSLSQRQLLREEFDFINQFINNNLRESLVADPSKTKSINKNIIMNLYLRWSSLRGRKILKTQAKTVKTKITEELKKLFPRMDHNQSRYRGIAFKQDIVKQTTTKEHGVFNPYQIPDSHIEPHESFEGEDFTFTFDENHQGQIDNCF